MSNDQKERIVKRALEMYIERGVKSVRMDDIAREMHVSKRTIYEIFGDKEELLYQSVVAYLGGLNVEMDKIGENAPNILISVLEVSNFLIRNSNITWRLRRSMSQYYPEIYDRIKKLDHVERYRFFRDRLMAGKEQGLIDMSVDLDLFISMLQYVCIAIVENNNQFIIPENMRREEAFHSAQVTLLRGVSTHAGMDVIDEYLRENKNFSN